MRRVLLGICLSWMAAVVCAQPPSAVPVEVRLQDRPAVIAGSDGRSYLVMEMHLSNVDGKHRVVTVDRLAVREAESGRELASASEKAAWKQMRAMFSMTGPEADAAVIAPAEHAVFFVWLALPAGASSPRSVEEELTMHVAGVDRALKLSCCRAETRLPVTIAAPLSGKGWIAVNGPSVGSEHRTALLPVDGRLLLGQRFAIDWIEADAGGKVAKGEGKKNSDFVAYGKPVLAVADGTVRAVLDGVPENEPGERAVKIDYGNIGGNVVVLDIGNGVYAGYAHLQPGSLRVKEGERVKRGEVLGLLGNSGNSDAPHLHFQLMDAPSIVAAEGLPYLLEEFEAVGVADGDLNVSYKAAAAHRGEIPLENAVVNLP